jgi:hypothetical protein
MSSGRSGGHISKPPKAPANDPGRKFHPNPRVTHQEAVKRDPTRPSKPELKSGNQGR